MQWCGHCKKLAPTFEQAATKLKSQGPGLVALAKMDFTVKGAWNSTYTPIRAYKTGPATRTQLVRMLIFLFSFGVEYIFTHFVANQEQVKKVTPSVIIRGFPTLLVMTDPNL